MENTDIRGDDRIGDHFLMIFLDVSDSAADAGELQFPFRLSPMQFLYGNHG